MDFDEMIENNNIEPYTGIIPSKNPLLKDKGLRKNNILTEPSLELTTVRLCNYKPPDINLLKKNRKLYYNY